MIRAAVLALAAVAISISWSAQPVAAREAPWCAVLTTSSGQCLLGLPVLLDRGMTNAGAVGQSRMVQSEPLTPQTTEPKRKARKGQNY